MDLPNASKNADTIARNHVNAREAYDTIQRILQNRLPTALQQKAIDDNLALLKPRLVAAGHQF